MTKQVFYFAFLSILHPEDQILVQNCIYAVGLLNISFKHFQLMIIIKKTEKEGKQENRSIQKVGYVIWAAAM